MLTLQGCKKCGGATHIDTDLYGEWLVCINCGQHTPLNFTPDLRNPKLPGRNKIKCEGVEI